MLPRSVKAFLIVVEGAGVVVAFAKEFHQQFEVFGLHIAGDGLWVVAGGDDDGGGEFEAAVRQVHCEHIAFILWIEVIGLSLPGDCGAGFGVEPDRIEFIAEVCGYFFVGIGFPVHLATPAAPGGVEVNEDGFL